RRWRKPASSSPPPARQMNNIGWLMVLATPRWRGEPRLDSTLLFAGLPSKPGVLLDPRVLRSRQQSQRGRPLAASPENGPGCHLDARRGRTGNMTCMERAPAPYRRWPILAALAGLLLVSLVRSPVGAQSAPLRVVIVGGGPDPQHNQVAIERNVYYVS